MAYELVAHPDTPPRALLSIEAQTAISEHRQLLIHFEVRGAIEKVMVSPSIRYADRRDGLWQTTCFEAFVRSEGAGYVELNFSPSTAWAAYQFTSYRGEPIRPRMDAPPINVDRGTDVLGLSAAVDLSGMDLLAGRSAWKTNLTAVIEETDGTKSYWALAHPPGAPDFHDPACFVLELPAPPVP